MISVAKAMPGLLLSKGLHVTIKRVAGPALFILTLLAACSEPVAPEAEQETAVAKLVGVSVHRLQPETWQGDVVTFGVVEGIEEVDVASEIAGTVSRVLVNEGDSVEVDDILLELDPTKAKLRVAQAGKAEEQARAQLDEAQLRLKRRLELAEQDTISEEALDSARLNVLAVAANHQQAVAIHSLALQELDDTVVRSPSKGLVDQRIIEPGEAVAIGSTLISLQVVHVMRVHTWVSEADITHLRARAPATVALSGLPGRDYPALVEWVGINADTRTGNFPVKLILQSDDPAIRPGMTATVTTTGQAIAQSLLLPEEALIDRDRRRVVFVAENGIARRREPMLAAGYSNRLQVLAGLEAGDLVIVEGQQLLSDGMAVSIQAEN
jgi:membrane fusion protein (multidrug efflux system)